MSELGKVTIGKIKRDGETSQPKGGTVKLNTVNAGKVKAQPKPIGY